MKQEQKILIVLILFILFAIGFFIKIGISLNSGEFGLVADRASDFLKLIHQGKYIEASRYVDATKIENEKFREIINLASHYEPNIYYFYQSSKNIYIIGFKPAMMDNDKINDNKLEFAFAKVNGEWKVISIYQ